MDSHHHHHSRFLCFSRSQTHTLSTVVTAFDRGLKPRDCDFDWRLQDMTHHTWTTNMSPNHRQEAVDWSSKVHAQFNFGPLCAYLSINYFDRFLAVYELTILKNLSIKLKN
ncbi:hypothetical protein L1887_14943 [Cichorium endivia]|nr:hypothetical protein L1887_14943 [Cichorium endivia]